MARSDTTESVILDRIITRLRSALGLDSRSCYESIEPLAPVIPAGAPWFVAVSLDAGTFVQGEQSRLTTLEAPGNTTESIEISVTAYTRITLDSTDRAVARLTDVSRGLLERKRQLLSALVGWDLLTANGNTMLRALLFAIRSSKPMVVRSDDRNQSWGLIQLQFQASYDWVSWKPAPSLTTLTLERLRTLTQNELATLPLTPALV